MALFGGPYHLEGGWRTEMIRIEDKEKILALLEQCKSEAQKRYKANLKVVGGAS